jgi:hypothetical protein
MLVESNTKLPSYRDGVVFDRAPLRLNSGSLKLNLTIGAALKPFIEFDITGAQTQLASQLD